MNEEYNVFIKQQSNGNLVVRRGTPDDPGDLVWESGAIGDASSYFTKLQLTSNLITWEGSPENQGDLLWKTDTYVSVVTGGIVVSRRLIDQSY